MLNAGCSSGASTETYRTLLTCQILELQHYKSCQPSCQDIINISANHSSIQYVPNVAHSHYMLLASFHISRWRVWWCYYNKSESSRVTLLGICKDTCKLFPLFLLLPKPTIFQRRSWTVFNRDHGNRNRFFKSNHDVFLTLTNWLHIIETREKQKIELQHKDTFSFNF